MSLRVVHERPPNYADIAAVFDLSKTKGIIFAYGDVIYAPDCIVPPQLMVHERVHCERQGADVAGWWRRYLDDAEFRLAEEVPAHRAEYRFWCARPGSEKPVAGFRSGREYYLMQIAKRLSSPLYGGLVSIGKARLLIAGTD